MKRKYRMNCLPRSSCAMDVADACANASGSTLRLARKTYRFFAEQASPITAACSNCDFVNPRSVGVLIQNAENFTLDGNGATLLCSGQMTALAAQNCHKLTLRNLTVDWDVPLGAEGMVLRADEETLDVRFNPEYRWSVSGGRLFFSGNGWVEAFDGVLMAVDAAGCLVSGTGDAWFPKMDAMTEPSPGVLRLTGHFTPAVPAGTLLVFRCGDRRHPGLFFDRCTDVVLENVTVRYTAGLGILAQFCHNLHFDALVMEPDPASGRKFLCGHDDGLHLSNNSGQITLSHCRFHGLTDDPINLHGTAVQAFRTDNPLVLRCCFVNDRSVGLHPWASCGDAISILKPSSLQRTAQTQAAACTPCTDREFLLTLQEPVPNAFCDGDALENLTNTAALTCRHSWFGSCRARGILVSTPRPVLIEDCVFESAGSAILLAGDAHYWYETGACTNVTIRRNLFRAVCCSCDYQFCEGVITALPDVQSPNREWPVHTGLRILQNTFILRGAPALCAHSTADILFAGNRLLLEPSFAQSKTLPLTFHCCSRITVRSNSVADLLHENAPTGEFMN